MTFWTHFETTWYYRKILKLAITFEVIDSILQKIVEIDIVDSQPMPCLNYVRAYKYTRTGMLASNIQEMAPLEIPDF